MDLFGPQKKKDSQDVQVVLTQVSPGGSAVALQFAQKHEAEVARWAALEKQRLSMRFDPVRETTPSAAKASLKSAKTR
ncbi:MAG: hypothetical protein Q7R47_04870 [Candidatus Diapherotrites archaeon]|nr:hypothetical protein [Candidatus Diapherotrites archaeon]